MAKRLSGDTAILNESAFSGLIIRFQDCEKALVQYFHPKGDDTKYTKPVVREIQYDETDSAGFKYGGHFYHLADFMRFH